MAPSWSSILLLSSFIFDGVQALPRTVLQPRAITLACQAGETTNCITTTVPATTVTSVVGGTTITKTFFPTTLSDFKSLTGTTATTVTTVDAAGAVVLAILGIGGAGYLVYQGAGAAGAAGLAIQPPPLPTFEPPKFSFEPTTSISSSSTPVSSSVVWTVTGTQVPIKHEPAEWQPFVPIKVPHDLKVCNRGESKDVTVRYEYARDSIPIFCDARAGQDASKGLLSSVFSPGAGRVLNISVSALKGGCRADLGQMKLYKDGCKKFLNSALSGCNSAPDNERRGGSVQDGCLQYTLAPSVSNGDLVCAPPRLPQLPKLPGASNADVSYAEQTGADRDEFLGHFYDMCNTITTKSVNGREVKPKEIDGLRWYYNPSKGNTQLNISLTYSSQVGCAQSGDRATYRVDREACKRFGRRLVDDCNTDFKRPYGKFGGSLTDGCGSYAAQTANVEPIVCNADGVAVSEKGVNKAIDQFCNSGLHLDPAFAGSDAWRQFPLDGEAYGATVVEEEGLRVEYKVVFDALPQNTGCQSERTRFAVQGDECRRRLRDVWSKCPKGGRMGAQQWEGCTVWSLTPKKM